uniref:Cyclin L2 n=1 Tax=Latimeria chalumnae TaxID=7897 RepID=H3BHZ3_LATCH
GAAGFLVGDRMYSEILLSLENCLVPQDRISLPPSVCDGLSQDTETDLRMVGCEFIQAAGILLRLPQICLAVTKTCIFPFIYGKFYVHYVFQYVSMACVHLASKIEEAPRRIRDVINVFHHLRQLKEKKKPEPLLLTQEYISLKNQVIKAERRILKELGFCVHVQHPHKIIVMYLQVLECERNRHLVQTAWNYMNDSLRTNVFLRFCPETIACACIYLAARTLKIPLPNRPHWFLLFGASENEIQEICTKILLLYTRKKVNLKYLESKVEKRKLALEEAKAKAKGLLPDGTPNLDITTGFSPVSKTDSQQDGKSEKTSPLSIQLMKNVRRKLEEEKRVRSRSPVNGITRVQKGRKNGSRSRSKDRSFSRSRSRSLSPEKRSKSDSTSNSSHSGSCSRSCSNSPPRQLNHTRAKHKDRGRTKAYRPPLKKHRRSHSRSHDGSASRTSSQSRERFDHLREYKKSNGYYRSQRHRRSESCERPTRHHERDYSGHGRWRT